MESACKETAGKGVKCRRLRRRSLHVYNVLGAECKLLILDVAVDLMSDAVRLEHSLTHSLTAALDQLRVVASSTSNDPGPRSRQHQQIGQRLIISECIFS